MKAAFPLFATCVAILTCMRQTKTKEGYRGVKARCAVSQTSNNFHALRGGPRQAQALRPPTIASQLPSPITEHHARHPQQRTQQPPTASCSSDPHARPISPGRIEHSRRHLPRLPQTCPAPRARAGRSTRRTSPTTRSRRRRSHLSPMSRCSLNFGRGSW